MGHQFLAKCRKCGKEFEVSEGGGFFFHLLHCTDCGKEKSVSFDEIKELHSKFNKGSNAPYAVASREQDKLIQDNPDIEPIDLVTNYREIETMLEKCRCGGSFTFKAKARCPKCKSDDYIDTGISTILYD
ncbi:MAG: hypothetical protein WCT77_14655 [Bacteroidota bacterium]